MNVTEVGPLAMQIGVNQWVGRFQLLSFLSVTAICRKQENTIFDNAFDEAGCIVRICSQLLTTLPKVELEAETCPGGCL